MGFKDWLYCDGEFYIVKVEIDKKTNINQELVQMVFKNLLRSNKYNLIDTKNEFNESGLGVIILDLERVEN